MVLTNRFLIAAAVILILVLLVGASWLLLAAADFVLLALALADRFIFDPTKTISADRAIGPRLTLRSEAPVEIGVENSGGRSVTVFLREMVPTELGSGIVKRTVHVDPGTTATAGYSLRPERRGKHQLGPLFARIAGPLGLATRQFEAAEAETVRVYPNISDIQANNLALRRRLAIEHGLHNSARRGLGTEFDSLRDYLPDDEWRRINWKVSSRRGKPITNIYSDERTQNIILAVDTSRLMVGDGDKLNTIVKAAVVLTHVALDKDDRVGLAVFSDRVKQFVLPRKGGGQLAQVIEALYDVEGELTEANYWEGLAPVMSYKRRSLIIIFTDIMDEVNETFLTAVMELRRRHLVLVLFIGDARTTAYAGVVPRDSESVFRGATALQLLNDRRRALAKFKQTGAIVNDVLPNQLTPALVNQYLEIKRRNRL